ncbi:MAG TPA: MFS transporter [Candidatus Limnocylindria bacterium]|nr:MFS transporter [Candidatus Limnocylindria bacterium]
MNARLRARPLWPAYLATFTFTLGQWASGVAIPLQVESLGGSLTEAGTITAIRFGLGAVFSLPFGVVADAWGTRRTLIVAVLGSAAVNLVPIGAQVTGSTLPLYAWAILSGLASSLFLPAIGAYVAGSAHEARRGSAFGWLTLGTHTGIASGPAVGGLAWQHLGIVPTYLVATVLALVALVGPILMRGGVRTRIDLRGLPALVGSLARDRVVVGCWVAGFGIGVPWGAVIGLFPLFGTSISLAAGSIGLLLALQSITNGLSRVPLGRLIDRRAVPPLAIAAGCAVYAAITALLGLQTGPLGIAAVFMTAILALAFTLMMIQVVISERAPAELRATGLGGYSTALSAGLGIGPFVAGAVAQANGFGIGYASVAGMGLLVAGAAAVLLAGATRTAPSTA